MFRNRYKIIKKSGLFDDSYYLRTYQDVRKADIDSLKHYIKFGWKEGRNPSENFDTNNYLEKYPELRDKNICPLIHKINKEIKDKRIEKRKLFKNIIINLLKLKKQLNKYNFNRLMYHLKKGNFSFINEKIFFYTNTEIKKMEVELISENIDNIYEILEFKEHTNPLVSIVIPVYNQFDFTYKCLKSILENTPNIDYEIIIADDVSSDETINISNHIKNIKIIRNEKNLGFLLNCNNAVKFARGKYIHLLNNDTQVQKEWLSSLIKLIESDEKIGMVGSKLVYPDGRQQEAGGIIWNDASGWNFGRLDDPSKPEYNYVKEVDYISGASIMLSKKLWNDIGGFDERYVPAYFEDSDLAFEIRKHGYKVMFQPKSVVVHFEGISHGTDTGTGIKAYQVKNREKFIEKWQNELETNHFQNAENVFLARDRSRNKKHILIIDHYVPHFDQDAGSRTMWQYLFMLKEMDFNITFIGDNFYKHEPYSTILENAGIEILYGPYYYNNFDSWLHMNGKFFDFVYLLRPHISIKYIDKIKQFTDSKIFYNGTDFHFLRMEREYLISKDKGLLNEINRIKIDELKLFEKSDCVLTISHYEKDYFLDNFPQWNIEVIPTYVYKNKFPLSKNNEFGQREGILFVGGFSHAPNLAGIKWFLENIWENFLAYNSNIKFYVVGSKMPQEISSLANKNIITLGFISDEELEKLYNHVRIIIAPLTFGAGVKGKIVESICHGVPVVTTKIGAEGIIDCEEILKIEDTVDKFSDVLNNLYNNEEEWHKMRFNQIKYAEEHFSYENAKKLLTKIFTK